MTGDFHFHTSYNVIPLDHNGIKLEIPNNRTSLAAQWLGLHACTTGGMGPIPGCGTKIPHATWHSQKKKEKDNQKLPNTWRLNRFLNDTQAKG